ncbi:MAG: SdiA-regulated domain-containing protein [Candidatus Latescibacteria bacterium]|nr:SdiA-regulated domain-containing protein [Candidatus Latescibacterota bacterium]
MLHNTSLNGKDMAEQNIFRLFVPLVLLMTVLSGCNTPIKNDVDPLDIPFPYQWVGNIDQAHFNEPSGIVFHPGRGTLFVVGDEGDVCEIQKDGTLIKQKRIRHADFEGITFDPSTGLLYIAIEGEEKIIELDPEDFSVLREFPVERIFQGAVVLKSGGQGIEAISFVPDPKHPQGGTFYVANQGFDLEDKKDPSAIFEVEAPLKSGASGDLTAKIVRSFSIGVIDLAGSHYDRASDLIYVISDVTNTFFEITRTGKVLRAYAFPGDNQEGITVDDEGFVYIAQDSGGIIKVKWDK